MYGLAFLALIFGILIYVHGSEAHAVQTVTA